MKLNAKHLFITLVFVCTGVQSLVAQALPVIDLPTGWYPNFPVTHWQETRVNITQVLNQNNITHTRNVAGELIWNDQVTSFPVETDLLFNPSDQLERITLYIHDATDAAIRHQQWFNRFLTHYGTDYSEVNNAEMHMYTWPNENQVQVELIWFKQNPNFHVRAEFLRR